MITANEMATSLRPHLAQPPAVGPLRFRHAVVDSRKAGRGDLFVALPGEHADGHDFVADAARRGATGALVARPVPVEVAQYVVRDPLAALQALAMDRRTANPKLKVIGITGSVGKTTTKEIVASVLATKYPVLKNEGNLNSEIGLPLVLLELTKRHRRAVLEMGMWAEGEMALLCQIAKPDIGVVTMVGPVHMERLGSIEAIAQEKGVLRASLPPDGVAVLNADDSRVAAMADRTEANVITYGLSPDADVRADEIESHGLAGVSFTLVHAGAREHVYSHLPGRAMVHNALAAAAVGLVDGLTIADVAAALTAAPARVRFHSRRGPNGSLIIDDAYNASPASVLAALDLLGEMPGRKIAVLGDMRELGAAETQGHRDVGVRAAAIADTVITVGALGRIIADTAREAGHADVHALEGKAEVAPFLRDRLREGDVVLLKASRALAFETIVEELGEEE